MERVRFEDIVTRVNTKEDCFNTDKIYYVGGEHIESNDIKVHQRGIIKGSTIGPMFYCGFKAGDVLFVTRNPHLRKCAIVDFDGICSEKTFVLGTKDPSRLLQEYLPLIMQSDDFWAYCEENKSGGVNFFVNWSTLANYEFELPSLEEQRVLADKLWAAYEVKESYKDLLAQTDKLLHAQFQKIQDEAKEQKLSSYIDIVRGVSYKPDDICSNDESSRVILRANNISNQTLNFDDIVFVKGERVKDIQLLKMGDVLMCASSGSQEHVGKVALVNEDYTNVSFGAFCLVVRGHDIIPEYLFSLLGSSSFRNHIELMCNGTSILNIRREYIEDWICPIADEHQQQEFVRVFNQAEQTKASLNKGIEAIEAVIRSLIAESTTKV